MTLDEFAAESQLLQKSELEKVALLAYFALRKLDSSAFSTDDVSTWFSKLSLAAPNPSRLRKKIRQSSVFISQGDMVRLHAKSIHGFDGRYPRLAQSESRLSSAPKSQSHTFVDSMRLQELRAITSNKFDLAKLIRLCEELNTSFQSGCYFASAMLTRSIVDHVPPVFGFRSFSEVANSYAGGKSIKESMQRLDLSCRKIADQHLHLQIRPKEGVPSKTQVDFSNDLDVLIAEIVRVLK